MLNVRVHRIQQQILKLRSRIFLTFFTNRIAFDVTKITKKLQNFFWNLVVWYGEQDEPRREFSSILLTPIHPFVQAIFTHKLSILIFVQQHFHDIFCIFSYFYGMTDFHKVEKI